MLVSLASSSLAAEYNFLDERGSYRGSVDVSRNRIDSYDRRNMPSGWIDRQSGATFDRNNNFRGWIISPERDDD